MRNMLTGVNPARAGEDSYGKSEAIMIEKQISRTKVCRAVQKISGGFGRFLRGKSETGRDDTSV